MQLFLASRGGGSGARRMSWIRQVCAVGEKQKPLFLFFFLILFQTKSAELALLTLLAALPRDVFAEWIASLPSKMRKDHFVV